LINVLISPLYIGTYSAVPKHFIRDCRVCAYVERRYKDVYQLFEDIVSGRLKDRVKHPKYVSPVDGKVYRDIFVNRYMSIVRYKK